MNGYDAASSIRSIEKNTNTHVPIIGLSGNARNLHIQKALAVGMVIYFFNNNTLIVISLRSFYWSLQDDYITKPYKKDEILKKIEEHCQSKLALNIQANLTSLSNFRKEEINSCTDCGQPNAKRMKIEKD